MRLVEWKDKTGRRKWSYIKDTDPDTMAPLGVPGGPPDMDQLDWTGIKEEVVEALSQQGLLSWLDVERNPTGLAAATNVLKRHLVRLYRQDELIKSQGGNL